MDAAGAEILKEGSYCHVIKTWKKGDRIKLNFNPGIIAKKASNGEYYLQRGEIVYCLDIPGKVRNIRDWPVNDLHDQYYNAQDGFNYKLQFRGRPETAFGFQYTARAAGSNMWVDSPSALEGSMLNPISGKEVEVRLVPIGSTILRQVTFALN